MEMMIAGFIILLLFMLKDPHTVRVQWNSVATFVGFMVFLTFIRIAIMSFNYYHGGGVGMYFPTQVWTFALVPWEDAFFVLPLVFLQKFKLTSKWFIWYPAMIGMSIWFGMGHGYQGTSAIFITALYPYFASYRYGRKFGFGTVMCCHVIYDFMTYYVGKFGWFLF